MYGKTRFKTTFREKLVTVINTVVLCLLGIIAIYPFYYILIYSLSDPGKALRGVYLYPAGFTLDNYIQIVSRNNIARAAFISLSRTAAGTLITLVCCSALAYGVSKGVLPFRKFIYRTVSITMYISVGLIPWYVTMMALGLKNNFLLYILPTAVVPFYVILLKTYFESLPPSLEEAALMDGADYYAILLRIVVPLSKPIIATVGLFQAVNQWNSWADNLYLCLNPKLMTLQLMLYNFFNEISAITNINDASRLGLTVLTPSSVRMTITVIAILPIFLVYPFLQRYFMKGILLGAVKG